MRILDWLSYPRGVLVTIFGMIWTLIMSFVIISAALITRNQHLVYFLLGSVWCWPIVWLGGMKVEWRGDTKAIDAHKGFLILFNHCSNMDIMTMFAYFPRSFRFGAKIELFKIPFFGTAMRACGILPIDRSNRKQVLRVYQDAIARVNNGECFALAPEGTRQLTPKLGSFKRGPFEFAIQAQMPIVPLIISGTYAVLPRNTIWLNQGRWRRQVILEVLPAIETRAYTLETSGDLQKLVRERMLAVNERLNPEAI